MACNRHDQARPKTQYQVMDEDFFAEIWGTFDTLEEAEKSIRENCTFDRSFLIKEVTAIKRIKAVAKTEVVIEDIEI